jgi:molybdopterin molybdotransferase
MATGSELITGEESLRFGKLYDSNALMITNLLRTWGYQATRFLPVQDEREILSDRLEEALEAFDLLITTGGVSVGDFDLVPSVLEALGVERLFWGVWMRPGTPLYAGKKGDKIIMAMSGNPAAAIVHAIVFLPTLLAYMTNLQDQTIGVLQKGILVRTPDKIKPVKHTRFLRGRWYLKDGHVFVEPHDDQSSGTLRSYCQANALLRIEASENLRMGTLVSFLPF